MKIKIISITLLALVAINMWTCKKSKIKNRSCSDDAAYFYDNDSSYFFLPNIFTPNSDGVNDVLMAFSFEKEIKTFKIVINKNNLSKTKVFESTDPGFTWDGSFKGKAIAENIYKYSIEMVFITGEKVAFDGTVTLVRENFSSENCDKCKYGSQFNGKEFDPSLPPEALCD